MTLTDRIISILRTFGPLTVEKLVADVNIAEPTSTPEEIQARLHHLDDAGHVILRNGWYRLSETAKKKR